MASKKDKPSKQPKDAKEPTRQGEPQNFWLPPAHAKALDAYFAAARIKPSKTAVFIAGLEMFLQSEGHWPPKP